jgi:3-hydroxyisobutyrate dehydrogenase
MTAAPGGDEVIRPRVGFIGLGRMGRPMAANLLGAGLAVGVFNRTPSKCAPLRELGASVATSPAELARESEVLITMLADEAAVRAVVEGPDGLLDGAHDDLLLVEMSTIGPRAARTLSTRVAAAGVVMIDAPVSGSIRTAEEGELTAIVGGPLSAYEEVRPILAAMTKVQIHLGESGAGAAMKLALNVYVASMTEGIAELLLLAEAGGIGRADAYEVLLNTPLASTAARNKRPGFLDPDGTAVTFTLELMRKDLRLATELAADAGLPLLGTYATDQAMTLAAGLVGADKDIVRVLDALRSCMADQDLFSIG